MPLISKVATPAKRIARTPKGFRVSLNDIGKVCLVEYNDVGLRSGGIVDVTPRRGGAHYLKVFDGDQINDVRSWMLRAKSDKRASFIGL